MNKDFKSVRRAFNSACGEYSTGDKKWIIDIDEKYKDFIIAISAFISHIEPEGYKRIAFITTKHGYHIISKPFNIKKFKDVYSDIDVHKNNPTILYIP
jgi:hypothetical protein